MSRHFCKQPPGPRARLGLGHTLILSTQFIQMQKQHADNSKHCNDTLMIHHRTSIDYYLVLITKRIHLIYTSSSSSRASWAPSTPVALAHHYREISRTFWYSMICSVLLWSVDPMIGSRSHVPDEFQHKRPLLHVGTWLLAFLDAS